MTEEWRIVKEFPNYSVSDKGRIRNDKFDRLMVPCHHSTGYRAVGFRDRSKKTSFLVHRLVGFAFVDGHEPGLEINHKDGDKANNNAGNLEWVTKSSNHMHRTRVLKVGVGSGNGSSKLTESSVADIKTMLKGEDSHSKIAARFNVSRSNIGMIANGKTWSHV